MPTFGSHLATVGNAPRHNVTPYARSGGIKGIRWIEDRGTGRNDKRDGLQRILSEVQARQVDRLIVWKLDRLSRSLPDMLKTLSVLLENKTTLIVTSQNLTIDGRSPFNDFLVGLFGLLGRLESDLTSERIKAGLAAAKENGKVLGARPHDKKRKRIQRMIDKGHSVSQIADRLGKSRQSVYQILERMHE